MNSLLEQRFQCRTAFFFNSRIRVLLLFSPGDLISFDEIHRHHKVYVQH